MWRPGTRDGTEVTCPACGRSVPRSSAREYDKFGNRWDRRDKEFEYLCKPCDRELSRQRRDELEDLLCEIGAGTTDRDAFLERYLRTVEERYDTTEES